MSQTDINLMKKRNFQTMAKIQVLNNNYIVESTLEGKTKSIDCSVNADSDVRKTCSLVMVVNDNSFVPDDFEIAWMDKLVAVYIGIYDNSAYVYYKIGTFVLETHNSKFDSVNRELTLNLIDLMGTAVAQRGSQVGTDVVIPYGSDIRNAIIACVGQWLPFKHYNVAQFSRTVPYDLEFSRGVYPYEILKKLISLYPYYEMYYDVDGVFTVAEIPTCIGDPVFADENLLDGLIISEDRSGNLANIKNSTEIWGSELDAMYTASSCAGTRTGDIVDYVLTMPYAMTTIEANSTFSFVPDRDCTAETYIAVNGITGKWRLYNGAGSALTAGELISGVSYVVKYVYVTVEGTLVGRWILQGEELIHVIVREMNNQPSAEEIAADKTRMGCNDIRYVINPSSPYACDRGNRTIQNGEIRQVLSGGDYDFIYTTQLAYERGEYENYCKARLATDVSLSTVLIPWMDVNKKIKYTSVKTGAVNQYIVRNISFDFEKFTMEMKLSRFYNYYPWQ